MKVLIAAGGTGGHFYPGLATARSFQGDGAEVRFVVRRGDYVISLLNRENIPYDTIVAAGFRRSFSFGTLVSLFKLAIGTLQSILIIGRYRPDLVLVMGGYLSVPPAFVAYFFRIPVILHEQNAKPGMANRLVSKWVKAVAVSFKESYSCFKGQVAVTGNPVRAEFFELPSQSDALAHWQLPQRKLVLLVFGGSLGAHRINQLLPQVFQEFPALRNQVNILHFTGAHDEPETKAEYAKLGVTAHVEGYCHQMPEAYAAADLVVCRSGASTICELMVVQKPAILIPYPLATEGHQLANAKVLESVGTALIREEKDLSAKEIGELLLNFGANKGDLSSMREGYSKLSHYRENAAAKIKGLALSFLP